MKLKITLNSVILLFVTTLICISCNNDDDEPIINPCGDIGHYPISTIDSISFTTGIIKDLKADSSSFKNEKEDLENDEIAFLLKVESTKDASLALRPVKSNFFSTFLFSQAYACSFVLRSKQSIDSISITLEKTMSSNLIIEKENKVVNSLFLVDLPWKQEDMTVDEFVKFQNENKVVFGGYGSEIILKLKPDNEILNSKLHLKIDFDNGKDFMFISDELNIKTTKEEIK